MVWGRFSDRHTGLAESFRQAYRFGGESQVGIYRFGGESQVGIQVWRRVSDRHKGLAESFKQAKRFGVESQLDIIGCAESFKQAKCLAKSLGRNIVLAESLMQALWFGGDSQVGIKVWRRVLGRHTGLAESVRQAYKFGGECQVGIKVWRRRRKQIYAVIHIRKSKHDFSSQTLPKTFRFQPLLFFQKLLISSINVLKINGFYRSLTDTSVNLVSALLLAPP